MRESVRIFAYGEAEVSAENCGVRLKMPLAEDTPNGVFLYVSEVRALRKALKKAMKRAERALDA